MPQPSAYISVVNPHAMSMDQKKESVIVRPEQREIGIGLMLGDAYLQTQSQGKTYRLRFEASEKHSEYVYHLCERFDNWVPNKPRLVKRINRNLTEVRTLQFQTLTSAQWKWLADIFLDKDGVKRIPPNLIQDHLSAMGLAYWFMDDGGKMDYGPNQGKGLVFNTQGFSLEEVSSLCEGLNSKFQLKCWPKKNKSRHVIAVSGRSFEDFQALTKDFIIPSMQEKLPFPSPRKPKRKATIMQKQNSKQDFKIETTDTDTESR